MHPHPAGLAPRAVLRELHEHELFAPLGIVALAVADEETPILGPQPFVDVLGKSECGRAEAGIGFFGTRILDESPRARGRMKACAFASATTAALPRLRHVDALALDLREHRRFVSGKRAGAHENPRIFTVGQRPQRSLTRRHAYRAEQRRPVLDFGP